MPVAQGEKSESVDERTVSVSHYEKMRSLGRAWLPIVDTAQEHALRRPREARGSGSESSLAPLKYNKAFTLIEMSVVLVIIAFIIGGVLTGQSLIKSSEERATITQIQSYNASVATFATKYNGLPGDLKAATAAQYGLFSGMSGGKGDGDGDGTIEGSAQCSVAWPSYYSLIYSTGEMLAFWRHLSDAQLLDGSYAQTGTTAGTITLAAFNSCTTATVAANSVNSYDSSGFRLFPPAKIGEGTGIFAAGCSGSNYFILAGMSTAIFFQSSLNPGMMGLSNNLPANEASDIDTKMDDGLPGSGNVWGVDATLYNSSSNNNIGCSSFTPVTTVANCVTNGAYNLTNKKQACSVRFQFN